MKLSTYQLHQIDVIKICGSVDATNVVSLYDLLNTYKEKSSIAFDMSELEYVNTHVLTALSKTYKTHKIIIYSNDEAIYNVLYLTNFTRIIDTASSMMEFEELCKNCKCKRRLVNS